MPFSKRVLRALYALVSSKRLAPLSVSSARKRSPEPFALSRIGNRETAGYLISVYLLTARKVNSANFALHAISEGCFLFAKGSEITDISKKDAHTLKNSSGIHRPLLAWAR
jgi:hypothetical protein